MEKIITKRIVINTLGKNLEHNLKEYGFKFVKSKDSLIRKTKDGFDKILMHTYDTYPYSHQDLFLQFSSRINDVENIMNKFYDERFMNVEYHKTTTTNSIDYNKLKGSSEINFKGYNPKCDICVQSRKLEPEEEEKKFAIHTEQDIEIITPLIVDFIKDKVFDFFNFNHDLKKLNDFYKNSLQVQTGGFIEIMRSLILMKLTSDSDLKNKTTEFLDFHSNRTYTKKDESDALNELIAYLDSI